MFDVENMQAETRAVPRAAAESKHRYTYRPLADILETEAGVELAVEMPGVDSDHVDIKLHRRVLTIKGRTQVNEPSGGKLAYSEYGPGDFERAFRLSQELDGSNIEAEMRNGMLKIKLPRAESAGTQRIEVKAA